MHFESDYKQGNPLNISLELYGGYDALRAGISVYTTSDADWKHFTGRSNVRLHYYCHPVMYCR